MGHLFEIDEDGGLYAFYRLIASVYFHRYCSAFQPMSTPKALFESFDSTDDHEKHLKLIRHQRKAVGKGSI